MNKTPKRTLTYPEIVKRRTDKHRAYSEMIRGQIVRTATRLFVKQGFGRTTMEDIAREVGMSKANLYNYFKSKDDFPLVILDETNQEGANFMNFINALPPETSATQRLCQAIRDYLVMADQHQEKYIFNRNVVSTLNPDQRKIFLESATVMINFFRELLIKGLETGEFKDHNPDVLSSNISDLGGAWAGKRWYWRGMISLEDYIAEQTRLILRQLLDDPDGIPSKSVAKKSKRGIF